MCLKYFRDICIQRIAIKKYEINVEKAAPTIPKEGIRKKLISTFKTAAVKLIYIGTLVFLTISSVLVKI